ncbi:MAG TPA: preprotein translocase subunit YajC [Gammaproteobacteria bacterium]|jgi:preprotein translocase subunit YajC|nr:preprotein translocase subunit YajC [Gammaproteobacteria bacterium]HAY41537.1 preprotein translocase subunit YajC [Gammaproteobacteria bacterium]|tara:strand:- start:2138 stop:2470 length:333 start_codon:yes stop_codon:yes gene_type:complete
MNLLDIFITPAFAAEGSLAGAGSLGGIPFLLVMFVLMYFLLIRPQQKRAKDHKSLLAELKKGDEIVTNGGVVGKIISVDDSFADLEISKGVIVKVQKQGINQKMPKGSAN